MNPVDAESILDLKYQVDSLRRTIDGLQAAITVLTNELKIAKATISDLKAHIEQLVEQIKARDQNLA